MPNHFAMPVLISVLLQGQSTPGGRPTELVIPQQTWETLFFRSINSLAGQLGLSDLRTELLADGDLELRVWRGFGVVSLNGYILRKRDGRWSAYQVSEIPLRLKRSRRVADLAKLWRELVQAGVLTIRDDSEIPRSTIVEDGTCYVVEIRDRRSYRTFMVNNPHIIHSEDGSKMLTVINLLDSRFAG